MAAKSSANAIPPSEGPPKDLVGDLREQRPRHREDHRDQVDDEAHHQHRLMPQVGEPVPHRTQPGNLRAGALDRDPRQQHDRVEGREEGDGVDGVQPGEPGERQHHAGDQRSRDRAGRKTVS